jgi:hypothetical protein
MKKIAQERLTMYERETIINFNQGEKKASIFTYDPRWQRKLENKLKLVPLYTNSHGGREYVLEKSQISFPRPLTKRVTLTDEQRKVMSERLEKVRKRTCKKTTSK